MDFRWLQVFIAAIFEVGWVIGLKHASTTWEIVLTGICILISFYLLIYVSTKLPVGTAYAVFVGLGTCGTVIADIVFFNASIEWTKIILIAILLIGVIGLKLVTGEEEAA